MSQSSSNTSIVTRANPQNENSELDDNKPYKFMCWLFTILVWLSIISIIIVQVRHIDTKVHFIIFGISYFIYFLLELCSKSFKYLVSQTSNEKMYEKMGKYFASKPHINFHAESYHYSADKKLQNNNNRKKEISSSDRQNMPIYSSIDVSGLFTLESKKIGEKKPFVKLHLQTEINFADAITYADYLYNKDEFWKRNRYNDYYMSFKETRFIDNFNEYNFIQVGSDKPKLVSCGAYIIFTLLTFAQIYKKYINSLVSFQSFKIRKLISTRYNLSDEYNTKYSKLIPALSLYGVLLKYDTNNLSYVNPYNDDYDEPTKEELEKAKKYEDKIPVYNVKPTSCEFGIIEDSIQFQNVNYNEPPPSFVDLPGHKELPIEKLSVKKGVSKRQDNINLGEMLLPDEE